MIYESNIIEQYIQNSGGTISVNTCGKHSNKDIGKISFGFDKWVFNAWFDFKKQTAHSPVYWINKKPRGGFQFTMGHYTMPIKEFLDIVKEMVDTNSIRIETRKNYLKYIQYGNY